jgi:phospholipid/cholesterol/gamma-HCH transport system substrate-binding protein
MARHNPAELVTGAIVLAVAGTFMVFAVASTGRSFSAGGTYDLHAVFDHVDGLSLGADTRIAGVKVGSVTAIALDPKTYLADVQFTVQNDVQLTDDSSATVASDGLLGGKYLALATGGSDKDLKPGGEITITQGSMNLEALIGKYIFGSTSGKGGDSSQGKPASSGGGLAPLK